VASWEELVAMELLVLLSSMLVLLLVFAFWLFCEIPRGKVCRPSAAEAKSSNFMNQRAISL